MTFACYYQYPVCDKESFSSEGKLFDSDIEEFDIVSDEVLIQSASDAKRFKHELSMNLIFL